MKTNFLIKLALPSLLLGASQISWSACTQTLSPGANVASAVSSAAAGSTICLNTGNYGSANLSGISKSSVLTIQSSTGKGATVNITMTNSHNITFSNLTIANLDMWDYSGNPNNTNISVLNNVFIGQMKFTGNGNGSLQHNIIDGNTFNGITVCDSCYEGRLQIYGGNDLIVSNNHFGGGGDSDGIQAGGYGGTIGPGNVFDGLIYTGARHVDSIQLYGEVDHETITGNFFINSNDGIMDVDGGANVTVKNNVFAGNGKDYWQVMFGSQSNLTFINNTLANGIGMTVDAKSGTPSSSNATVTNNILSGTIKLLCTACSITKNLFYNSSDAVGTNNIIGIPQYIGGTRPTTLAGYQLSPSSLGYSTTTGNIMGIASANNITLVTSVAAPSNLRLQ